MNIVVLDGHTLNPGDLSWEGLERLGELQVYERTPTERIVERARNADIVFTNKTPLRRETLARLPRLTYIGVLATGYDVVDVRAAEEQGATVTNVPAYGTDSVAQHVFALLLELCHRVGTHDESVRRGEWGVSPDFCYWRTPLTELAGKTFGVVGLGRIGVRAAEIASAFGMKVKAYSRSMDGSPPLPQIAWADLDGLLAEADVVSLHCPLTPGTQGLINRASLARMKPSAFLINTSRGKLIVEEDLARALEQGAIAGAALDVLAEEPPAAGSPLIGARNCVITPHIAWASREARSRLMDAAVGNLEAYLRGTPRNRVNQPRTVT